MNNDEQIPNNERTKAESSAEKSECLKESPPKSRREFLSDAATISAAIALASVIGEEADSAELINDPSKTVSIQNPPTPGTISVELEVNGKAQKINIDPRASLLDSLREYMGLTGTKKG